MQDAVSIQDNHSAEQDMDREGWAGRYADVGDEGDYRSLIQLAGEILEYVARRLPSDTGNPAETAMASFIGSLIETSMGVGNIDRSRLPDISGRSWRECLEDTDVTDLIDWPRLVEGYTSLYAYGDSGVIYAAVDEEAEQTLKSELDDAIKFGRLLQTAADAGYTLHGICRLAGGRWALDHQEPLAPDQVALLGSVDVKTVRNAISSKELASNDGMVPAATALEWLKKRRKFRTSRWLEVGLETFTDFFSEEGGDVDYIFVPKDRDGRAFLPDLTRQSQAHGAPCFTIGPKGRERQVADYHEALAELSKMPTPCWRRPNRNGIWGIVSASGQWDRIRRDAVDRMIDSK